MRGKGIFLVVQPNGKTYFTRKPTKRAKHVFTIESFYRLLCYQIDNIFVTCGTDIFRQICGVPMGVDDGPLLANIFLFVCEFRWLNKKVFEERKTEWIIQFFNLISRYIDDLLAINNRGLLNEFTNEIYPIEMELEQQNPSPKRCTFLDLQLEIVDDRIISSTYDKRDTFPFPIVKFTSAISNVDYARAHDPIVSAAHRELTNNDNLSNFIARMAAATKVMIQRGLLWDIVEIRLTSFFKKHPIAQFKFQQPGPDIIREIRRQVFDSQ